MAKGANTQMSMQSFWIRFTVFPSRALRSTPVLRSHSNREKRKRFLATRKKGRPSTAEAKQIMAGVDAVEEVLDVEDMPDAPIDRWDEGSAPLDNIRQAFAV